MGTGEAWGVLVLLDVASGFGLALLRGLAPLRGLLLLRGLLPLRGGVLVPGPVLLDVFALRGGRMPISGLGALRGGSMPISGLGLDLTGEADTLFDTLPKHSTDLLRRRLGGEDVLVRAAASSDVVLMRLGYC